METYVGIVTNQEHADAHEYAPEEGAPVNKHRLQGSEGMFGGGGLCEDSEVDRGSALVRTRNLCGPNFLCRLCHSLGWSR